MQLGLYQVDAGYRFGHSMFDLQARIGFDKVELARVISVQQKLEGAQAQVLCTSGHGHGRIDERLTQDGIKAWSGGQLDDFLMIALSTAFPLP